MKVVALGGAGGMGRHAVRTALGFDFVDQIVVADRDLAGAELLAARLGSRVTAAAIDVEDDAALRRLLRGAGAVLNTVGPFYRFGTRALRAAIDEGCHYLDIDDDWEPTLEALELDATARARGVTAIVGMGASPGVSNLLAVRAMAELDRADELYTGWSLDGAAPDPADAEEGGAAGHDAAVLHFVRQITGTIRVRRDGAFVDVAPLEELAIDVPGVGGGPAWTVGHPEAVTLPRHRPEIRRSANLFVAARPVAEALRELASAVDAGTLAPEAIPALIAGGLPAGGPDAASAALPPLFALACGAKGGRPATAAALVLAMPGGGMGGATGVPLAVGLGLVARGRAKRHGVLAPEDALDPGDFFDALAPLCSPPAAGRDGVVMVTRSA